MGFSRDVIQAEQLEAHAATTFVCRLGYDANAAETPAGQCRSTVRTKA